MSAAPSATAPPEAIDHPEIARLLRELRLLRDDFRDERREMTRLRESLEQAIDQVETAAYSVERAVDAVKGTGEEAS